MTKNKTGELGLYKNKISFLINQILLPLKLLVPQPIIRRIPGLTTNEEVRLGLVLQQVKGRLLDIGCGPNKLVVDYRAGGGTGTGVDVYPWQGIDILVKDTAKLPFADGCFDTVTFVACLNHIPNRLQVLQEASRILIPKGKVIITNLTPGISKIWHKWAFWDEDQHERGMVEGEVWGFSNEELTEILQTSGFTIQKRQPFSWRLNELWVCEKK